MVSQKLIELKLVTIDNNKLLQVLLVFHFQMIQTYPLPTSATDIETQVVAAKGGGGGVDRRGLRVLVKRVEVVDLL